VNDNDAMRDKKDYAVGYGKPPQGKRFVKGQSGNWKGRPKGSKNLTDIFLDTITELVPVTENGRTRSVNKFRVSMKQLVNKAASGDLRAIRELGNWIKKLPECQQNALQPPSLTVHFISPKEIDQLKSDTEGNGLKKL
jgi:Family of unknown function (DUF5681)